MEFTGIVRSIKQTTNYGGNVSYVTEIMTVKSFDKEETIYVQLATPEPPFPKINQIVNITITPQE